MEAGLCTKGHCRLREAPSDLESTTINKHGIHSNQDTLVDQRLVLPAESNVGEKFSRAQKELSVPQRLGIYHEDFKFPPMTPMPTKGPWRKPGSGFEGAFLETVADSRIQKPDKSKSRHENHLRYRLPRSRPLKLSGDVSPSLQAKTCRTRFQTEAPLDKSGLTEETHGSENQDGADPTSQVNDVNPIDEIVLGGLLDMPPQRLQPEDHDMIETLKGHQEMNKVPENDMSCSRYAQNTRAPSKSERNGWLKRRRKVSFATEIDVESQQVRQSSQQEIELGTAEQIFEKQDATWYSAHHLGVSPAGDSQGTDLYRPTGHNKPSQPYSTIKKHSDDSQSSSQASFGEEQELLLDNPSQHVTFQQPQPPKASAYHTRNPPIITNYHTNSQAPSPQSKPSNQPLEIQDSQDALQNDLPTP